MASPAVRHLVAARSLFPLLLLFAAATRGAGQVAVPPPIISRPPPPVDTTDLMAWNVRDIAPADSAEIYRVALTAGLNAILGSLGPRARPVYLDGAYPLESAQVLSPWLVSGAIRRVCRGAGQGGCPVETAHSIDLLLLTVIHRDTALVSYEVDARRRPELPMQLVGRGWMWSRTMEIGIFTPLDLPGRPCLVELLPDRPHVVIARAGGTWVLAAIDPSPRPSEWSGC